MKLRYTTADDFLINISSDDALFHYTGRAIVFEEILHKNCFLLFTFKNTNDPLEYKDRLIDAVGWGWENKSDNIVFEITNTIDFIIKEKTHFASFCKNKFNNDTLESHGFLKPRMWSQYGESHKGLCLVFSKNKVIQAINKEIENTKHLFFHDSVKYCEYVHDSTHTTLHADANLLNNKTPHEIAIEHINKCYRDLFFIKQNDFEREDEYRFIICDTNEILTEKKIYKFDALNCLIGIIAGDRFHKAHYPIIKDLIQKNKIVCRKLHWEKGEYFLFSQDHFFG